MSFSIYLVSPQISHIQSYILKSIHTKPLVAYTQNAWHAECAGTDTDAQRALAFFSQMKSGQKWTRIGAPKHTRRDKKWCIWIKARVSKLKCIFPENAQKKIPVCTSISLIAIRTFFSPANSHSLCDCFLRFGFFRFCCFFFSLLFISTFSWCFLLYAIK